MKTWFGFALAAGIGMALGACGDGGGSGGVAQGQQPNIEVQESGAGLNDGSAITVSVANLPIGVESRVATLQIENLGNAVLRLTEVSVTSEPAGVFRLVPQGSLPLPSADAPLLIESSTADSGLTRYFVDLMFTRSDAELVPSGSIVVRSNSKLNERDVLTFPIKVEGGTPEIQVTPNPVNFMNVAESKTKLQTLTILNTGAGDLEVTAFTLSGSPTFALLQSDDANVTIGEWPVSADTMGRIELESPIVVPAGTASTVLSTRFSPTGPDSAQAQLVLFTNDPGHKSGLQIPLVGNQSGPCILLSPKKVNFGGKLVGTTHPIEVEVKSCGEGTNAELVISEITLDPTSSGDFSLDLSGMPLGTAGEVPPGTGSLGQGDAPVVLPINATATFKVSYLPDEVNPPGPEGKPIPDLGMIHIKSNTFVPELDVEVTGFGVAVECPTAVIIVQEGEEVIPQTKLHLLGSQSYAASGAIKRYEWTAQQPVGSQSVLLPSFLAPDPTFEANVAGEYVFTLTVYDQNDEASCEVAEVHVFVVPDEAIHVELVWDTPGDPNQSDEGPEAGADLDLHFAHPFASNGDIDGDGVNEPWFDVPHDCYWFNADPNWGSLSPTVDDNPGLDRDDTDGAGPENLNLNLPEEGLTYRVGVHYWSDHDFGPSKATVRIYIYSSLRFEVNDVELVNDAMWEVATVAWPSGDVTLITQPGGEYRIIPNYPTPFPSE
ncbi:MAG: choice-of-anchor D domain-containing protein [Deltaproteobacteria bacterium]|nr:choice-of-anchor D domain-containing protein [Deltaproteobacteria bacterium]MCB9785859.1 choice-of-anchor D domain-containing protein [Deltaproteobacteria bacterium]